MSIVLPQTQRRFAQAVVRSLRRRGFEAYWAGGCVRDQLLGREPHDYDVATNATPEEVRRLFGHQRTLAIGAAFGVVTVLGPRQAGPIEVATFRRDAGYSDGRHPDGVTFSSAREDALRRDFTINGLFFDPLEDRVIDFVGGREDLAGRLIRAIGEPRQRFAEDKLRMLRAVRFAAEFDFALEADTQQAIGEMAEGVRVVSAERIAGEMNRMLVSPGRAVAVRLLVSTGLAAVVLPELAAAAEPARMTRTLDVLGRLEKPSFALALAALLGHWVEPAGVGQVCRRWRLSSRITERAVWLAAHKDSLVGAASRPWSAIQRIVVSPGIEELLRLIEATAAADGQVAVEATHCRGLLTRPREELDPPPILTGDDLARHGIPPGPAYGGLLERVRNAQLDGQITRLDNALALVDRLLQEGWQ